MVNTPYDAIDIRYILLENYKKMGITENELAVIFMIQHLLDQGNSFITQELLALKMTLPIADIDRIIRCINHLFHRPFYSIIILR